MTGEPAFRQLVGGIVAYRDGPRVADAVRSLLEQELPEGSAWTRLWVVVSPDELGTEAYAREAAGTDPRVEVVLEPRRRGKSAALAEIFSRARGDLLVLLNGDARAAPGSVREILKGLEGASGAFGIMARPVPPPGPDGLLRSALALLWGLHDRWHRELFRRGEATHLSDELFALPIDRLPPLREGIITDGAFAAAWILSEGGELRYAPLAKVHLSLPARTIDHLEQRRRIHVGHWQVERDSGQAPSTLESFGLRDPGRVLRLIASELPNHRHPYRSLAFLLISEVVALGLARFDILRERRDYAIWPRVVLAEIETPGEPAPGGTPG